MSETTPLAKAVIKCGDAESNCPAAVNRLVTQGWEIKQQIESLQQQLGVINDKLIEKVGPGNSILVDGVVSVAIAERETLKVTNPDGLAKTLGDRYGDLVQETVSYKLTDRLKTMLADGDDKTGKKAREHVSISISSTVTYRAGKPLPAKKAA